ncbi:hypothetical protein H696_05512 [Fonticula alba]|uniref:DNA (Cytosine-5-)-methyltransferase n=1 Tax=Fonticula alba TaxID=691883 RepID=A0A058Z1Q5_FONAL|nr:hypothetical protein H696_05512 [Fonticula alba]KCV68046.1 hypothetical protein H696_05512 [Fonticula alba]|eukprot:XP_009497613.1 hypothetical protein H696_05512 [Fonticula alba]
MPADPPLSVPGAPVLCAEPLYHPAWPDVCGACLASMSSGAEATGVPEATGCSICGTDVPAGSRALGPLKPGVLTALEFFSGLGGLHMGLCAALSPAAYPAGHPSGLKGAAPGVLGLRPRVAAAFDLNDRANAAYEHNFGLPAMRRSIDSLRPEQLPRADVWLLSPPCQPYTRGGRARDDADFRSTGLLRLVRILAALPRTLEDAAAAAAAAASTTAGGPADGVPAAPRPPAYPPLPKYLLLENVPGFERSRSRARLVSVLLSRGYAVEEWMASPRALGGGSGHGGGTYPYERVRYFLLARLAGEGSLAPLRTLRPPHAADGTGATALPISTFLDTLTPEEEEPFLVPEAYITRPVGFRFDLVFPEDTHLPCFTKAYGSQHIFGSGAFLATRPCPDRSTLDLTSGQEVLALRPRFFTPREICRMHGLPIDGFTPHAHGLWPAVPGIGPAGDEGGASTGREFTFPPEIAAVPRHAFELLGNSLSSAVVGHLLRRLLARRACVPDAEATGAALPEDWSASVAWERNATVPAPAEEYADAGVAQPDLPPVWEPPALWREVIGPLAPPQVDLPPRKRNRQK